MTKIERMYALLQQREHTMKELEQIVGMSHNLCREHLTALRKRYGCEFITTRNGNKEATYRITAKEPYDCYHIPAGESEKSLVEKVSELARQRPYTTKELSIMLNKNTNTIATCWKYLRKRYGNKFIASKKKPIEYYIKSDVPYCRGKNESYDASTKQNIQGIRIRFPKDTMGKDEIVEWARKRSDNHVINRLGLSCLDIFEIFERQGGTLIDDRKNKLVKEQIYVMFKALGGREE